MEISFLQGQGGARNRAATGLGEVGLGDGKFVDMQPVFLLVWLKRSARQQVLGKSWGGLGKSWGQLWSMGSLGEVLVKFFGKSWEILGPALVHGKSWEVLRKFWGSLVTLLHIINSAGAAPMGTASQAQVKVVVFVQFSRVCIPTFTIFQGRRRCVQPCPQERLTLT